MVLGRVVFPSGTCASFAECAAGNIRAVMYLWTDPEIREELRPWFWPLPPPPFLARGRRVLFRLV